MKKILSFFFAVILMVSLFAVTASAAGTSVSGNTVEAYAGGTATVNIYVSGNTGFDAACFDVSCESGLTITGITKGLMNGYVNGNAINHASTDAVTADGVLFSVTVSISPDAQVGKTYGVYVSARYMTNSDVSLGASVSGGAVKIICDHNYVAGEPVEATCTDGGYTLYTCSICGDSYKADETAALGHDYAVTEAEVPATCTEPGKTAVETCSRCGATKGGEVIDALGHDYQAVVTDPTCTEKGFTTYTCSRCGDSYKADEVDALGHDYKAVVTAPTCTDKGYTTYTCSRCGDSYKADETAALGHDYKGVVTAPTCTEKGYTTYTCSRCGDSYKADETAALGHDLAYKCGGKWGKHTEYCKNGCGHELEENCFDVSPKDGKCDACGCEKPVDPKPNDKDDDEVPKTGDITPYGTYMLIAMMAVVATVFGLKRKFDV